MKKQRAKQFLCFLLSLCLAGTVAFGGIGELPGLNVIAYANEEGDDSSSGTDGNESGSDSAGDQHDPQPGDPDYVVDPSSCEHLWELNDSGDCYACSYCTMTVSKGEYQFCEIMGTHVFGSSGVCENCGTITYIGADGNEAETTDYTLVTSSDTALNLNGKTTVVIGDVTIKEVLTIRDDTNLILCDGATLTIASPNINAIKGQDYSLNIFVQSGKTGKLSASSADSGVGLYIKELNIYGGTITTSGIRCANDVNIYGGSITSSGKGIKSESGNITISGGTVTADYIDATGNVTISGGTVTADTIFAEDTISLGWTNPTDSIKATIYDGTVTFANGKSFIIDDGDIAYWNTIEDNNIDGKTLTPATAYTITLNNLYGDISAKVGGETVTSAEEGATVTLTVTCTNQAFSLNEVSYNDGKKHIINPVNGVYSFTMPAANVTVNVSALPNVIPVVRECVLTFNANGGSGTMDPIIKSPGAEITLPECTFTPPAGKKFKCWKIDGSYYDAGGSFVMKTGTAYAIWEFASDPVASGNCGAAGYESDVTWSVTDTDNDGTPDLFTISGTGDMADYETVSYRPWHSYANNITAVTIGSGITKISNGAFYSMNNLTSVTIEKGSKLTAIGEAAFSSTPITSLTLPAGVTSIGDYAFNNCTNLTRINYLGTKAQWNAVAKGIYWDVKDIHYYNIKIPVSCFDTVTYIDKAGTEVTLTYSELTPFTVLTGNEEPEEGDDTLRLPGGIYVVNSDISYTVPINFTGDVDLILCDNATLTISGDISANSYAYNLTVYAQSAEENAGSLECNAIKCCNYTQHGGIVNANDPFDVYSFNLTGGTAEAKYNLLINNNSEISGGTLEIYGTMTGSESICVYNDATLTISGGYVKTSGRILVYQVGGKILLCGGTINTCPYEEHNAGTIEIAEGYIYTDGTNTFTGPYTFTNDDLTASSGKDLRPVVTYTVAVTPVDVDGGAAPVNMTGTQTVAAGSSVTLTAPSALDKKYNFVGWYEHTNNVDTLLWSSNEYTFTVTKDINLYAKYKAFGSASLTIDGGNSFTINGSAKATAITADYKLGTTVNVTTNDANFAYWKNSYGMVLSRSASYTFTVTGTDTITAVFDTVIANKATLVFESYYGQIMAREQLASQETMSIPSLPYRNGYTAVGWDLNGDGVYTAPPTPAVDPEAEGYDEYRTALLASDSLEAAIARGLAEDSKVWKILPVYELKNVTYTITVTGGTGGGTYNQNDKVTVTANEPESGYKFSHWEDGNGTILGYNTEYQFFADRDLALTAVFVADTATVNAVGTTEIVDMYKDTANGKLTFVSMSTVPEGCTIKKAGVIATNLASVGDTGNPDDFTADTAVFAVGNSWNGTGYRYTFTKGKVQSGDTWYVRAYLVYSDANGNSHTVYGDIVSQTL